MVTRRLAKGKYTKGSNPYKAKTGSWAVLDPEEFNAQIAEHGIRVLHEKITLCPNYRGESDSGVHVLDCPLCHGSNFIHFDPQEIWGLFQQNSLVQNFFTQGWWDRGTALLTTPTHLEGESSQPIFLNYFDKITLLDFEERFHELIHKSKGNLDKLKYPVVDVNFLRTTYKEYHKHKDFDVTDDGYIKWKSDNHPSYDMYQEVGELFTVSYLRRPIYRVLEIMHEGRYSQYNFKKATRVASRYPQQVLIKKDFLIQRAEETQDKEIISAEDLTPSGP